MNWPLPSPFAGPLGSVRFTYSAMAESRERLFPESRNRSPRIHKKLVKRFGGEFRRVPAILQTPFGLFVHPSFKAEIDRLCGDPRP